MKLLCLDFESRDAFLSSKINLGAGWVYALNTQTTLFKLLGFSYCWVDTDTKNITEPRYVELPKHRMMAMEGDTIQLLNDIKACDGIIAHNAQYEIGCLLLLGIDVHKMKVPVYDTKIMATLYDNNLPSTSLDSLSKKFLPPEQRKKPELLINIVRKHALLRSPMGKPVDIFAKTYPQRALKFAYENMDLLQEKDIKGVAEYCNYDIISEANLFLKFMEYVTLEQAEYWSSFTKRCAKLRSKGVTVDLDVVRKGIKEMTPEVERLSVELHQELGGPAAISSIDKPIKLAARLIELGYKLPKANKGGDSVNGKWLKEYKSDPLLALILEYRSTKKILKDFFIKTYNNMKYTSPESMVPDIDGTLPRYGKVYPQLNLFGARATGRFSSSNPNEQNIPKRDEKYGALCRAMFVPDDQENVWVSLDWKNQEGRLQVHFANKINAPSAKTWVEKYRQNPDLDQHQETANLTGLSKAQAKPINLGISYGMQSNSLGKSLGNKPVMKKSRWGEGTYETANAETLQMLKKYHAGVPYIQFLIDYAKSVIVSVGHITTLGGRKLRRDPDGRDYTGISKVIQGSAADIMYKAFELADDAGINIKAIVHDEFCIEIPKNSMKEIDKMVEIMENTYKLDVPMRVEVKIGSSWGTLYKL